MFAPRRSLFPFQMRRRDGLKLFILSISFILQFHSAYASPPDRWQNIEKVGAAGLPGQYIEMGYECGNDFFSDSDIKNALSTYHQYMDQNLQSPLLYQIPPAHPSVQLYLDFPQELHDPLEVDDLDVRKYLDLDDFDIPLQNNIPQKHQNSKQRLTPIIYYGPLYSDSWFSNYVLWPIQNEKIISTLNKYSSDSYYIVIKKNNGEFIDLISTIKTNYHTRCIRIDGSKTGLSTLAPEMNNCYQCAHDFLDDELIQKSLRLLRNNIGKISDYPASFDGRLYPADGGYKIWPIFSRDGFYDYNSVEAGPYFIVIDRQGNVVGAVVEGLSGNFLRCPRSVNFSKLPPSNTPNHSQVPKTKIKSGYYCGGVFFDDNAVQDAANAVKNSRRKKPLMQLPANYKAPQFDERIFLWPLMQNGVLYKTGSLGFYRVILTSEFNVKGVAIMYKGNFKLCEKGTVEEEKHHVKSDYVCVDHVLSSRNLNEAAKNACNSFLKKSDRLYPALYKGPEFDNSGPYFTYPVWQASGYQNNAGRDRVVINTKCKIVGVLTIIPDKKTRPKGKRFVFCIKSQERTAEKSYLEPATPISEHKCGYRRRMLYRHT